MSHFSPSEEQLRQLIGQEVMLDNRLCQIVEVLKDGPSLVVECVQDSGRIQGNQFGDGNRRVNQHRTVPVYSSIGDGELHPVFIEIWKYLNAEQ